MTEQERELADEGKCPHGRVKDQVRQLTAGGGIGHCRCCRNLYATMISVADARAGLCRTCKPKITEATDESPTT